MANVLLGVSVSASNNYLRFDKIEESKTSKISESIVPQKILTQQVKKIAEDIKSDIDRNLRQGLKYTGGKVAKLKPSTIKRKGHSRVFLDTGKLFNSVVVKKIGKSYVVTIKPGREEEALYLVQGTDKMVSRPFFGITKKRANELVRKHILTFIVSKRKQKRYEKKMEFTKGVI